MHASTAVTSQLGPNVREDGRTAPFSLAPGQGLINVPRPEFLAAHRQERPAVRSPTQRAIEEKVFEVATKKSPNTGASAAADAFTRASALLDSVRLRVWDSLGLTVTQLRVLGHLNDQDGLGNAELADRLFVTRPSVSALLERLERNGFIRREISLADRRGIHILLEPAGREAVNSVRDEVRQYAASLMEGLTEDQVKSVTAAFALINESSAGRKR